MSLFRRLIGRSDESVPSSPHSSQARNRANTDGIKLDLQDPDPGKRAAAAVALGQIRDPASIRALAIARTDVNENVRNCAVDALDSIDPEWRKNPDAKVAAEYELNALSSWLSPMLEKAEGLLATSERVLELDRQAEQKDERAFAAIEEAIRDKDATVRMWAAKSFGKLGDHRAISLLEAARTDFDERVRNAAEESISTLKETATSLPGEQSLGGDGTVGEALDGVPEADVTTNSGASNVRSLFKAEAIRFLSSENTKVYEAKNDAWWSHDDLKLVIAKEHSGTVKQDTLFAEADAAIEELAAEGKIKGTASGYRIAKTKKREDLLVQGTLEVRPDLACGFCGDDNVTVGYPGSHLRCASCDAIYCRANCQLTRNGGCPGCGEVDRWNYVES